MRTIHRLFFYGGFFGFVLTVIFLQDRGFVVHLLQISEQIPPGTPILWQKAEVGKVIQSRSFQIPSAVRFHPAFRYRIPSGSILIIPESSGRQSPSFLQLKVLDPFSPPLKEGDTLRVRPVHIDEIIENILHEVEICEDRIKRIPMHLYPRQLQREYEKVFQFIAEKIPQGDWRKDVEPYMTDAETMKLERFCLKVQFLYNELSPRRRRPYSESYQRLMNSLGCLEKK